MTQTQTQGAPPNRRGGKGIGAGFADDDMKELGDRIANLPMKQAKELLAYIQKRMGQRGKA